uniref:Uncharacterized protein n=1 Tax=Neolamprologus brichardi TaxID=32507 RepID=A0A3Q4HTS1_NEOBR
MIKIAIPKEHPYSSHISRFAMFPSFHSPDDPHTGVRAASQSFLNLSIPNSAPDITLLSKTKGAPYRLESLETPLKTRKKAVMWTGEHGFFDGESQVFYPTPPKMVLPNLKLRDWDLTLSERTSNILKNMEKTLWVTSYQMHYTGKKSHPVFVPSKARQGCRKRLGSNVRRSSCSPTAAELQNTSPTLNQSTASPAVNQPQEITAMRNEAPDLNQIGHTQSECIGRNIPSCSPLLEDKDQTSRESHPKLLPGAEDRERLHGNSNPCIMPRTPVLPGSSSIGTVGKSGAALTLLDLQHSFSKSEAHRKFNSSITHAAVNLRDNVVCGKKHNFYGINCYYIHG